MKVPTLTAAIQMQARVGDVPHNLALCERMVGQAAASGARLIMLPEFFSTGMAFDPSLHAAALPHRGAANQMLETLAKRHNALVGGSFLCLDADREVRNAFFLVGPSGTLGRHDKDLPTMWENNYYCGRTDSGKIELGDGNVAGAAVCWELIRADSARKLRGTVDVMVGGSAWWSVPAWHPHALTARWQRQNNVNATTAPTEFAKLVGAPFVHAAHCGQLQCRLPGTPAAYRGQFDGGATICDAAGTVLAARSTHEGPGVITAAVTIGRQPPVRVVPDSYWLVQRGVVPSVAWTYQRWLGRRAYRRRAAQRRTAAAK